MKRVCTQRDKSGPHLITNLKLRLWLELHSVFVLALKSILEPILAALQISLKGGVDCVCVVGGVVMCDMFVSNREGHMFFFSSSL